MYTYVHLTRLKVAITWDLGLQNKIYSDPYMDVSGEIIYQKIKFGESIPLSLVSDLPAGTTVCPRNLDPFYIVT